MKVSDEIRLYTEGEDQIVLTWLFSKWHMRSEWYSGILVKCSFVRYGKYSYQTYRVWAPTEAGRVLYENRDRIEN